MTRYLVGLMTATATFVAGAWLAAAPRALGYRHRADATKVDVITGIGLALLAVVLLLAWALAWRARLRADGVLRTPVKDAPEEPAEPAPPEPPDLQDLLAPLVAALTADQKERRIEAEEQW